MVNWRGGGVIICWCQAVDVSFAVCIVGWIDCNARIGFVWMLIIVVISLVVVFSVVSWSKSEQELISWMQLLIMTLASMTLLKGIFSLGYIMSFSFTILDNSLFTGDALIVFLDPVLEKELDGCCSSWNLTRLVDGVELGIAGLIAGLRSEVRFIFSEGGQLFHVSGINSCRRFLWWIGTCFIIVISS